MARPAATLDQAVTIENSVDRAFGRNSDIAIEPPDEEFADLAGSPMGLLGFEADDQALDLLRQLIGVANGPPRSVGQRLQPVLHVAVENLVAGLARYAELPAHVRHRFPVQHARDEPKALLHDRTRFPRHQHLPPAN